MDNPVIDNAKLEAFAQRAIGDLTTGYTGILVSLGAKLGLYKALAGAGPLSAKELARRSGCAERYVREWLNAQAAGGYLGYHARSDTYELSPEQALVLADENSPLYLPPAWEVPAAMWADEAKALEAFRTGRGVAWGEHDGRMACGVAAFYRNGYRASLVPQWLPALDGVVAQLEAGIAVADVGCGHGHAALLMAQAFPASRVFGFDTDPASIDAARRHAAAAGLASQVRFMQARATDYPAEGYGLICFFDTLHDLGDPVAAARHAAQVLAPGGTVLLVEPFAHDRVEDNLNPVGQLYYAGSSLICCAHAIAEGGHWCWAPRPVRHGWPRCSARPGSRTSAAPRRPRSTWSSKSGAEPRSPAMDQLRAMRILSAVADDGGFAAAARRLDLAPSVVTRQIADLEQALGARLFTRSTRRVLLTPIGQRYLERVRRILREVDEAARAVQESQGQLRGRVRLRAPPLFAAQQLMPRLAQLQARHPDIRLDLQAEGPVATLDEAQDISLVVRHGGLDGDFVAHRLAVSQVLLCAAPAYLQRQPAPRQPAELAPHALLLPAAPDLPRHLVLTPAGPGGPPVEVLPRQVLLASPNAALCHAGALAGLGIAALPSFAVQADLQQGRLQPVLADWRLFELSVFACVPSRRQLPAVVRAVLDFLREEFPGSGQDPWVADSPAAPDRLRLAA